MLDIVGASTVEGVKKLVEGSIAADELATEAIGVEEQPAEEGEQTSVEELLAVANRDVKELTERLDAATKDVERLESEVAALTADRIVTGKQIGRAHV